MSVDPRPTLYVSDFDGTLRGDEERLDSETQERIAALVESGRNFTIATARTADSLRESAGPLPLRLPIIELNGAFVSDFTTGEHLAVCAIDRASAEAVRRIAASLDLVPIELFNDGETDHIRCTEPTTPGAVWYMADGAERGDRRFRDARWVPSDDCRAICLTFLDSGSRLTELAGRLSRLDPDIPPVELDLFEDWLGRGWHWLKISSPAANKGDALKTLAKCAGMEGAFIVAYGDQTNDLSMLAAADLGVAVSNAAPEVLAVADLVIGSVGEKAVLAHIATHRREFQGESTGAKGTTATS